LSGLLQPIDLVLLDAMGVIYAVGDDVGELLIPFLRERGTPRTEREIQEAYLQVSLGAMAAWAFWETMGVDPTGEDDYLSRHRLQAGLEAFLDRFPAGLRLACLSNDVSEWSRKLRIRFGLEPRIPDWLISGDLGLRKPDGRIYDQASQRLGVSPGRILFVDDRLANVRSARARGLQAVLFDAGAAPGEEPAFTFEGLSRLLGASGNAVAARS
jgi:putative hydrolase of the HAD superfamily